MLVELARYLSNKASAETLHRLHAQIGVPAGRRRARTHRPQPHATRRRLGQQAVEAVVADYLAGMTTREVAERYGISKTAVIELLRPRGVLRGRGGAGQTRRS